MDSIGSVADRHPAREPRLRLGADDARPARGGPRARSPRTTRRARGRRWRRTSRGSRRWWREHPSRRRARARGVTLLRRLDHVAILVRDTDEALRFYEGRPRAARRTRARRSTSPHVRLTYLDAGNAFLQLVEPLDPDSPLADWLDEHGEGLHHICFGVDDVAGGRRRLSDPGVDGRARERARPRLELRHRGRSHGVRIECTEFVRAEDVDATPGWLDGRPGRRPSQSAGGVLDELGRAAPRTSAARRRVVDRRWACRGSRTVVGRADRRGTPCRSPGQSGRAFRPERVSRQRGRRPRPDLRRAAGCSVSRTPERSSDGSICERVDGEDAVDGSGARGTAQRAGARRVDERQAWRRPRIPPPRPGRRSSPSALKPGRRPVAQVVGRDDPRRRRRRPDTRGRGRRCRARAGARTTPGASRTARCAPQPWR